MIKKDDHEGVFDIMTKLRSSFMSYLNPLLQARRLDNNEK